MAEPDIPLRVLAVPFLPSAARSHASSMQSQQPVLIWRKIPMPFRHSRRGGLYSIEGLPSVRSCSSARRGARSRNYLARVCLHGGPVLRGHHAPCAAAVALHPLIRLRRGRHSGRCAWRLSRRLAVGCRRARFRAGPVLLRRHLLCSSPSFTLRACSSASPGLARSTLPVQSCCLELCRDDSGGQGMCLS